MIANIRYKNGVKFEFNIPCAAGESQMLLHLVHALPNKEIMEQAKGVRAIEVGDMVEIEGQDFIWENNHLKKC